MRGNTFSIAPLLFLLNGSIVLAGCSSTNVINSTLLKPEVCRTDGSDCDAGLVYALPKGQVQISAQRRQITKDDVAQAQKLAEAAASAVAEDKASVATAKKGSDQAAIDTATAKQKTDEAIAAVKKADADKLATEVDSWVEAVSLSMASPAVVPDSNRRYLTNLNHNESRDDNLKISVSNGLLSTIGATSTDQTPNIILSLAQAAAMLAGVPVQSANVKSLLATSVPAQTPTCKAYQYSAIFDPTDENDVKRVVERLNNNKPYFVIDGLFGKVKWTSNVTSAATPDSTQNNIWVDETPSPPSQLPPPPPKKISGLAYRSQTAITLTVAPKKSEEGATCTLKSPPAAQAMVAIVPDSNHEFVLGSEAGPFTTTTLAYAFKDGMPTDYADQRPSEYAVVAGLPVNITKSVFSILTDMIQLRVNHDSQANALIAAKAAELEAQLKILKDQQALEAARAATAKAAAGTSSP